MAKLESNTFGGFRGKLGNVVGYSWKGVWCIRSRPAKVRNPRSEAQQRHRTLFAEEVRLAGRMSWALNLGFAAVADEMHMTPQNVFVKANQGAFSAPPSSPSPQPESVVGGFPADNPSLSVDWSALIISAGPVAPIALGAPYVSEEGVLAVSFEKNPYHLRADNFDQVHLYVYCPAEGVGYLAAPVYRKEQSISVVLPEPFVSQDIQIYAFVTDKDGRASDTVYCGQWPSDGEQLPVVAEETTETPATTNQIDYIETTDRMDVAPHGGGGVGVP